MKCKACGQVICLCKNELKSSNLVEKNILSKNKDEIIKTKLSNEWECENCKYLNPPYQTKCKSLFFN